MKAIARGRPARAGQFCALVGALALLTGVQSNLYALTLEIAVTDPAGTPVSGFRWLLEEDNTNQPVPGALVADSLAVSIHKSHAPVVDAGRTAGAVATVDVPGDKPYFVSVLPDSGHTMSGARVAAGETQVTVIVNPYPVPTAQISILAFRDTSPINNAPEIPAEQGLPGFTVVISDAAGQQMLDAFGNPLGTQYVFDVNGDPVVDVDGQPTVAAMGDGVITTNFAGEALVRFLPPGKFGVQIIPPAMPPGQEWYSTTTKEGTRTIDAWVKAGEPPVFVEFGPAAYHIFMGFVQEFDDLATLGEPADPKGSITGRIVFNHFSRPPTLQGFFSGEPVEDCLVGLNEGFSRNGVYVAACEGDSSFTINDVPAGIYQLVTWDKHMDAIFGFNAVTVPDPVQGWNIDLGDVLSFRWFGTLEGSVFYDADEDGFRDPDEIGIPGEEVLLRFRDGTVYQATPTDMAGDYSFSEVFPFFKWLVTEVGFLRMKATGVTNVVDYGGQIPPDGGWAMPSGDKLNPQPQAEVNPNTGNNFSRTEIGEVLTQAVHLFLGQTNVAHYGKSVYGPGENGGISGIVFYAVTRAEHDPAYAAGEEWEPGIPRVQVNLYQDADLDGVIDELNGDGVPTLADVDNYPLGWFDDPNNPAARGPEDVDWNLNGIFDPGDALQVTYTDSWDDDTPTGCIQDLPVIHGQTVSECFDNFGTWNQIRPGVFDGGFAFGSHFPGGMASGSAEADGVPPGIYIVEAVPPKGYHTLKEEDKNVDYGDAYVPGSIAALPPPCVGDLHTVPPMLTLFEDIEAPFAGEELPLCDRKQVFHSNGQNTGVEFFMFTDVPKAARAVGFINNDLAAEFDYTSPVFGEKQAPSWIPISFQDYAGNEITRAYCDEFGAYNAMLPSTYTVNIGAPTGVSPQMISMILNHPGPIPDPGDPDKLIIDPYFDTSYSQTPYTFNFESGKTTYLDTPVIPVAAFAGYPTRGLDVEPPDGTPVLHSVTGKGRYKSDGPVVCSDGATIVIQSMGNRGKYNPNNPHTLETRDYGFGKPKDEGEVTVDGVQLTVKKWNNNIIEATVDTDVITTGQLLVTRGDNGLTTPLGVTLHVNECDSLVSIEAPGTWPDTPIQDAIDAAAPGSLIVIAPGVYKENLIVYKNVKLQAWGAGSTILNASPVPFERVTAWHNKVDALIANGDLIPMDTGFFEATEAPGILIHGSPGTFDETSPGLVDAFTIMGGVSGGGIYAAAHANYLQVSNNKIINSQGTFGGGITVGIVDNDGQNTNVNIIHNTIAQNGGIDGGGGVTIFRGSHNYNVADNLIIGNFSRTVGGGVAHFGLSDGGTIAGNQIVFNEVFFGALLGGEGGGIYIGDTDFVVGTLPGFIPEDPVFRCEGGDRDGLVCVDDTECPGVGAECNQGIGSGTGSVSVVSNLIQGNLAGSGSGGGIRAIGINGDDALVAPGDPAAWFSLDIFNNMIVNNVSALRGGGIALQDAAKVSIIHNTIANNDSTATAALAFPPGNLLQSDAQGAGIAATQHHPRLVSATGQTFSNPELLNNILWHNHSFSWDGTLNAFQGGLVANTPAYWDLQVVGGGTMDPQYCVLSDTAGYAPTNIAADPNFATEYDNGLLTAALIDEGGNFISIRYAELAVSLGDYHIGAPSQAIDNGGSFPAVPELGTDYDSQPRPAVGSDIGADEVLAVAASLKSERQRKGPNR
ncbi:MAG: hypothetical protein JSU86_20160 [Phycisphaerales bacterium]|nr:MAG: hypothetical protein JSU86_20160 [Phycisphaerales bacterium]